VARPSYLFGLLRAAEIAAFEEVPVISAIEFGVGEGEGLLLLEEYAAAVERETGIGITVVGFDTGKGLPEPLGNFRDNPDIYEPGESPMDEEALRLRLGPSTTLILGDVAQTVPPFVREARYPPVGFIACDLVLYSSTRDALQMLSLPERRSLRRVVTYVASVTGSHAHQDAGPRLAIAEFNDHNHHVKIDRWHGVAFGRVFPEAHWLHCIYVAHDLEAITKAAGITKNPYDER
jgi:hypothetical protein